jgi:hypothetical protein
MKGTLHKTESGWVVKYYIMRESSHAIHPNEYTLPILDHGYVNGPGLSDSNEGQEVEFEIIDNREICNCACHKNADITHFVACCNDGYKTDNFGHVNYYAKLVNKATRPLTKEDAWPEYPSKLHQLQIQVAEACFKKYPNNEELYPTDELKDAYKAGVIDGLKEFTLDSYDRAKYPEVKIICPRCKVLMPCECNPPKQTGLLNSIKANPSWDRILKEFISANSQTNPLTFELWLVDNYNPPTKKTKQ